MSSVGKSVTPFLEKNAVLMELDQQYAAPFISEESVLAAARRHGFRTTAIGKVGPIAIQDLAGLDGRDTLVIDDKTGSPEGIPVADEWRKLFAAAGLDVKTPERGTKPGENANPGDFQHPGTVVPNTAQQQYLVNVITRVALPTYARDHSPFVLVFWSRDPDGTQHAHGDAPGELTPGINGPTSLSAVRNVDRNVAEIEGALQRLQLDKSTNIIIAADHGFSTISKTSATSSAAKLTYLDTKVGELPLGFLAIDLLSGLRSTDSNLKLYDPDRNNAVVEWEKDMHTAGGNALIGADDSAPQIIVAANGGSDLIYLTAANAWSLARRVADVLLTHDYVSGIFVDDRLGPIAGTLPLSAIHLKGAALTPIPSIVVNFKSFATGCDNPVKCTVEVADTKLQQGQGMHGSFSRADTWNFMAAIGPDFKAHYVDSMPASNADIGRTLMRLLNLKIESKGCLQGRVLSEALIGGHSMPVVHRRLESAPAANGLKTIVRTQSVGNATYFDAGGFVGRTVGLE